MSSSNTQAWSRCAETKDNAALDSLLADLGSQRPGEMAMMLCNPWLVRQLDNRGHGPLTWLPSDWWPLVGRGFFPPSNQTSEQRKRYFENQATLEAKAWSSTQDAAHALWRPADWAILLGAAMRHPNPQVFKTWVQRVQAAGLELNGLVVPPGRTPNTVNSLPRPSGSLLRVARSENAQSAARILIETGLDAFHPEPLIDPAWSAPGWTLQQQLEKEHADPAALPFLLKEWDELLVLARSKALNQTLPAARSSAAKPRF